MLACTLSFEKYEILSMMRIRIVWIRFENFNMIIPMCGMNDKFS